MRSLIHVYFTSDVATLPELNHLPLSQRRWSVTALLLAIFACICLQLQAQPAPVWEGQWQGTLESKAPARVLLKLKPDHGGPVRGVVYLLDSENAEWPHATSMLNIQNQVLSFRIANLDATFTGKLSNNRELIGTWTQHGDTSLRLANVSGDAAWPVPVAESKSMPTTADPSFDVATIKPANPKDTGSGFQLRGQRLHVRNETLEAIVCFAYGIHRAQIQGAPAWFSTERWEIDGLPNTPGSPNLVQMRMMYRKLLAERFALNMHLGTRELSVYVLQITSGVSKLTRSLGDPNGPPDSTGNWNAGINDMRYTDMTMDEFAKDLAYSEDRPVVNDTHLSGRYDFRLHWASADAAAASQNVGTEAPPVLFTAIRDQLGLTVKANRMPTEVYSVAHIERPSEN